MKTPKEIVDLMLQSDAFSRWMGLELVAIEKGFCTLRMKVQPEMLNGFHILHGGISYALADSALAFAANAYGHQCVSIETSISHLKPCKPGDELRAEAKEIQRGKSIGRYEVNVYNQSEQLIAHFKGTVHISEKVW